MLAFSLQRRRRRRTEGNEFSNANPAGPAQQRFRRLVKYYRCRCPARPLYILQCYIPTLKLYIVMLVKAVYGEFANYNCNHRLDVCAIV